MSALPQFSDESDKTEKLPNIFLPEDLVSAMFPDDTFSFSVHGNLEISELVEEVKGLIFKRFSKGLVINDSWLPDEWSGVTAIGVLKAFSKDQPRSVVEVGSGLGPILAICEEIVESELVGIEYNESAVDLSRNNVNTETTIMHGSLLSLINKTKEEQKSLDVKLKGATSYACLPQMLLPNNIRNILEANHTGNYYSSEVIDEKLKQEGMEKYKEQILKYNAANLGLIACYLAECDIKGVGDVFLNLGRRPGETVLSQMFKDFGREPEVVVEMLVPQDIGTDFKMMAESETENFKYEFFIKELNSEGRFIVKQISAREAYHYRHMGEDIYHKLSFIKGKRKEA